MSDKRLNLDRKGYSDSEAIDILFPGVARRHFWIGVLVGVLAMAIMDFTDLHVCVGECDGEGLSLIGGGASE